jgi:hypothetical protein
MHKSAGTLIACTLVFACTAGDEQRGPPDSPSVDSSSAASPPPATSLSPIDSGAPRLLPRDEADESFRQFRATMLDALARRDTTALYAILAPEIKNSFGGDDGIDGFRRVWRMDDPQTAVWSAFARVLRMGGRRTSDTTFTAPYVYAFWPDDVDAFEHVAVTTENAVIRTGPAESADALGTASHSIIRFTGWSSNPAHPLAHDTTWAHVGLRDKREGWMRAADVYSPVSWRAMFVKRQGRWLMVLLVAGD